MTRWKLSVLASLTCMAWMSMTSVGRAKGYPVSVVTRDAVCHASMREAAAAGLRAAAAMSRRVEYAGAVFQLDAYCFVYSEPVTSHKPNSVEYIVQSVHDHMLLVGIYHTHTPGGHANEFSPHDREEQRRLGVPSYVGTISARTGEVTIRVLGESSAFQPAHRAKQTAP
jgi:hypothetical protein